MLWWSSLTMPLLLSTGKERFESSSATESKKNLIFLFVLFRYAIRLVVIRIIARVHRIAKRADRTEKMK
jgi:hypothetical protein